MMAAKQEGYGNFDSETGLTIRHMTDGDLDGVVALAASLPTAPQWGRRAYQDAIAIGDGPRRVALVAERDGKLIGFVMARVVESTAEIESIAIARGVQRSGIGSALMQAAEDELRLAGVAEVELEVRPSNQAAIRFYERIGFVEVGRRSGYYRDPEEDAVLLRLIIAGPEPKTRA